MDEEEFYVVFCAVTGQWEMEKSKTAVGQGCTRLPAVAYHVRVPGVPEPEYCNLNATKPFEFTDIDAPWALV